MKPLLAIVFLAVLAPPVAAQHQTYRGQENRDLKALSAEEVEQYLAGAGMAYAKAAELNHFPGPMHVLELAAGLNLSPDQRRATQQLMDAHKAEARTIGARLVEAEIRLDTLFRGDKVEHGALAKAVQETARLQGEYRLSHLDTHRRMRALLSDEQVKRYDALRGYDAGGASHPQRKH